MNKVLARMIIGLLGILSVQISMAQPSARSKPTVLHFELAGKDQTFFRFEEERLMISQQCGSDIAKMTCDAWKNVKIAATSKRRTTENKDVNPGAALCEDVLKFKTELGTDSNGNETTFCIFKDGSMIENGSLYYHAMTEGKK